MKKEPTSDPYAEAKQRATAEIDAIKAGPDALVKLQELHRRVMSGWGSAVRAFAAGQHLVDELRKEAELDPQASDADALEFPNWLVAEVRKAIDEVQGE